jgi:regulatory protein
MIDKEITGIKIQKRNPERVSIYLDGEYAFGLSRIVAAWLQIGQRLGEEKIKSLSDQDSLEVAYQKALRFLNHRPRTEKEIRQKLIEKGFESDQTDVVIAKLRVAGLVEDGQFARMWVENRNAFHPRSQRLIKLELLQKGVAVEEIESALVDSADDAELATQAAMQQIRKYDRLDWLEFRKKLSAFLMRRGFSYGTIAPVVRSVWESVRENQNQS